MRASKAAELVKARPQFAPFKGELPPLNPDIINKNVPQLQAHGLINRDLDTPPNTGGGSTKLSLIQNVIWNDCVIYCVILSCFENDSCDHANDFLNDCEIC
ncbi:hypothetical protein BDFB_001741 [Asbolus verrucosus]|uniref:Uncharacterized protein n=1 Tax=Asbolus verrucosus TaxID=1661398 RepID=A0A482VCK3_ASBVE|nr:hypothetical protein BDFB_001741 [Asbolus verrucosus]